MATAGRSEHRASALPSGELSTVSPRARPGVEKTWVVIPALDEASVVGEVVRELRTAGWRVLVVDDGSKDDTSAVAREAGAIVLRHVVNRGQGAALQTGVSFCLDQRAERIVTFDADGQHRADDVSRLIDELEASGADIVLGSRFLGNVEGATRTRLLSLKLAVWVSNRLSGLPLTDAHCGIRAIRGSAARSLELTQDRMAHASEILRKVKRNGLKVREVPVTVRYSEYSKGKGQSVWQALRVLFDYFFGPRP